MTDTFEMFLLEMRAVPYLAGDIADQMEAAFRNTKAEALRKQARAQLLGCS